jgi:hypothetical protein
VQDPFRFDALSRTLGTPVSRRGSLAALLGGTLGLRGLSETSAKHKKNHKKKQPAPSPPSPTECQGSPDGAVCGPDGCKTCLAGSCVVSTIRDGIACRNGGCMICRSGVCSANPTDNGICGADGTGRCYLGECAPRPMCAAPGETCTSDAGEVVHPPSDCCSGRCQPLLAHLACAKGGPETTCARNADCLSNACIAYHCQ